MIEADSRVFVGLNLTGECEWLLGCGKASRAWPHPRPNVETRTAAQLADSGVITRSRAGAPQVE